MRPRPSAVSFALALALALLAPAAARAQLLPGRDPFGATSGRLVPIPGARLGWSIRDSSPSVGAQIRLPLPVPVVRPSITAGGDIVFQEGLREWQATGDGTLGVFAPLYFGGGPAVLNSVFEDAVDRQTKVGYTIVAGIRGGRSGRLLTDLEFRWIHVAELNPRFLMLVFSFPLLGGR